MNTQLGRTPFFAGEAYTIADIALYAYSHAAGDAGFDLEPFAALRAWLDRVRAQPGFGPTVHPYSEDPSSTKLLPSFSPRAGAAS